MARAQVTAVLVATEAGANGTPEALTSLAGVSLLERAYQAVATCSRVNKVLVVCSDGCQDAVTAGIQSCGLYAAEVLALPSSPQPSTHSARLVAAIAAAACSPAASAVPHLVVLDASVAPEPGHSVAKMVEAGIVRGGAAMLAHVLPLPGMYEQAPAELRLEGDPTASTSRVTELRDAPEGGAPTPGSSGSGDCAGDDDGEPPLLLGPCMLLSTAAAPAWDQAAASGSGLAAALAGLGGPLYSGPLDCCFDPRPNPGLAAAFFDHYEKQRAMLAQKVASSDHNAALAALQAGEGHGAAAASRAPRAAATPTVGALSAKLATLGVKAAAGPAEEAVQALGSLRSTRRNGGTGPLAAEAAASGRHVYQSWLRAQQDKREVAVFANKAKEYVVPGRFTAPDAWKWGAKPQHPCYTTSSASIGAKQPRGFDMPRTYTGIHGQFTETFHGQKFQQKSMKTNLGYSRVHRALDEL